MLRRKSMVPTLNTKPAWYAIRATAEARTKMKMCCPLVVQRDLTICRTLFSIHLEDRTCNTGSDFFIIFSALSWKTTAALGYFKVPCYMAANTKPGERSNKAWRERPQKMHFSVASNTGTISVIFSLRKNALLSRQDQPPCKKNEEKFTKYENRWNDRWKVAPARLAKG